MAFSPNSIQQADAATLNPREIPYNYTSSSDRQAVSFLLGAETVRVLDELRSARVTGRSARILMRLFGEVLIHRRNPYLYEELVTSAPRRKRFFENAAKDLETIFSKAEGETRVLDVLAQTRALIAAFRDDVERTPELRSRIKRSLAAIRSPKVGGTDGTIRCSNYRREIAEFRKKRHKPMAIKSLRKALRIHFCPIKDLDISGKLL